MSYKILEKNGVDNENIDGGAFNNFTAGNRDGVIGGVLSECNLSSVGNAVSIGTGVLMIHGIRVKITSLESVYVSSAPVVPTRYQIIAQITLTDKLPEFFLFVQEPKNLTQQELYENDNGVYEVEIGRFTHNPDGSISDLTRTVDTLYGAAASGSINVGNVTVREIDAGNPPEVDIDKRMEDGKEYLDFDFGMPKATSTDAEAVHFTAQDLSESQKQQVRKNIGSDDVYASKSGKFKDMGVGSLLIEDTRDTNPLASEFSQIEKTEFKTGQAIGLPADAVQDSGFYSLKTIKGCTEGNYYAYQQAVDASNGGNVVSAGRVFYRYGNGEKWNAWREFLTAPIDYNSYDFTNVIVGKTVPIEAEKQPKVNTVYINCAISGSVENEIDITLTFINCTGTFLNNSNTIKVFVYSSPKLTVTGRGAENWRNIFINGKASYPVYENSTGIVVGTNYNDSSLITYMRNADKIYIYTNYGNGIPSIGDLSSGVNYCGLNFAAATGGNFDRIIAVGFTLFGSNQLQLKRAQAIEMSEEGTMTYANLQGLAITKIVCEVYE